MAERKQPDACKMFRFCGFQIRVIERVLDYDKEHQPVYGYEPMMKRKETTQTITLCVGVFMTANTGRYTAARMHDSPIVFADPNEAQYAAVAAIWRWIREIQHLPIDYK